MKPRGQRKVGLYLGGVKGSSVCVWVNIIKMHCVKLTKN